MSDWLPISEYNIKYGQVIGCHKDRKWIRFGQLFPSHGSRWYYSATNERTQYAQIIGDEPTHFMHMLKLPGELNDQT